MLVRLRISIAVAIAVVVSLVVGGGVASAAAWLTPVPLNLSNGSQPSIAVDGVGNTVATWQTSLQEIQIARHQFGVFGFQQLPDVANDPTLDNTDGIVVVNPSGNGFVAWVQNTGFMADQQVDLRTIAPGGILNSTVQHVGSPGGNYSNLTGAINAAGDAVIAWTHGTATTEAITRHGLGGTFTSQQVLDTAANGYPSVAIDSSGNALTVWPTSSPTAELVFSRHAAGGASWGAGGSIVTLGHTFTNQAVSANPNGQVVVAFQDSVGPVVDAVGGTVSGGFGATPAIQTLSGPATNLHGPGVNVDDSGAAVVGWTNGSAVQYSQRPGGASFPPPGGVQSISPVPVQPNNFELGGDGRGDVIATWYAFETGPNHNVVRAAVKPAGSVNFGASQIISDPHLDTTDAKVVFDQNGDAVAGLSLFAGMPTGVEAAVYDGAPPAMGAPNGPTTLAVGQRGSYSVTAPDAFSGVSVRWSFGDGSAAVTGNSVSHTFTRTGKFTVTVTATDTAGNSAAKQLTVTVTSAPPPKPSCRVPKLKGKTLSQARTLLGRAHCRLGKVRQPKKPKHRKLRKLIVASSSPPAGRVRPNGTKVSLTLKEAPKPKPKPKH